LGTWFRDYVYIRSEQQGKKSGLIFKLSWLAAHGRVQRRKWTFIAWA
jgi:D-alanyl-lipoteichoic acid acyltransferase DltB (MBOAT superfamily)